MLQLIGVKVPFFPQFVCFLRLFHSNDFDIGVERDQKTHMFQCVFSCPFIPVVFSSLASLSFYFFLPLSMVC